MHGHALPGDRTRWTRDRAVDTRHIALEVALDFETRSIAGTVTHHVAAFNEGLTALELDAAEMTIDGVTVAGETASYDYDGERLRVRLDPPPRRGDEFRVGVTYRATPRIGLYFVGPDDAYPEKPAQVWTQCQDEDAHYWVPCLDHPNGKQTTEMKVTVPSPHFVISNGRLLEEKENRDGTRTFHWLQERPHSIYLLTLVAGEFSRIEGNRGGSLPIDYFVEPGTEGDALRAFENTPAMVELFESVTGAAFPWVKYSQVVVRDFVFGGMENTSATTMTELLLLDEKAAVDATGDHLVAHELAHMWFGDLLTCRDWAHGWLNEGFASYCEALWEEHHRGIDEYRQYVLDERSTYLDESGEFTRPIVSSVFNEPIDIFDRHLYEKGSLVLHTLRGVLGDDGFFRSVRRYVATNADRNVVTQDLVEAIAEETGRELEWFFDQWVMRPGHPKLEASWSWDDEHRLATVTVKQNQGRDSGTALFRVPMTIDFLEKGAVMEAFPVELTESEHRFVFPLGKRPAICRVDPYGRVLKELTFEKGLVELKAQLTDDDDIGGRSFAAQSLGKQGGNGVVEALEQAVRSDPFWGVQAAAAKALGELRSDDAREALVRLCAVEHPKARRAVAAALGRFRGDQAAFEALTRLADEDASWLVEGEANRSTGKLRHEESFGVIERNMARRSWRETVHNGCLDGLVELRDERGIELAMSGATYGRPPAGRAAAITAASKLGVYFEPRRKALAEDIAAYLTDPDLRVRIAAARALERLDQREQAAALDAMAARELDGRAVRTARRASQALRKGDGAGDVRELREEFEAMRREQAKLREAIERADATGRQRRG